MLTLLQQPNAAFRRFHRFVLALVVLALFSASNAALAQTGKLLSDNTKKGFTKSNQSKAFFHDGTWWVAAPDASLSEWFLWKKQGAVWNKTISLGTPGSIRLDCHMDSGNNKLYILAAHGSNTGTKFMRATYNPDDDTWTTDVGFPVTLTGFTYQGETPAFSRARKMATFGCWGREPAFCMRGVRRMAAKRGPAILRSKP